MEGAARDGRALPGVRKLHGTGHPSGSRVTIEPVDVERVELGDIVVVKVGGETMLHLVKTIDRDERRIEVSGTSGPANGWTSFDSVYAICTRIED